jgi:hypothetical protein
VQTPVKKRTPYHYGVKGRTNRRVAQLLFVQLWVFVCKNVGTAFAAGLAFLLKILNSQSLVVCFGG